MLVPDRRPILLLKADTEAVDRLDVLRAARARLQVASASNVGGNGASGRRPGTVVVTTGALGDPATGDLLAGLSLAGVRIVRPHEYYERVLRRVSLEDLDESWFLFHRGLRARRVYALLKGLLDRLAGLLGTLVVGVVVVPLVALLIRLDDGGPVFFRQERIGRGGRPFQIWKFRTMRLDAEPNGPVWASDGDARVTRVGRFLRRTRLDELPQFFNVLGGDMSLVGPRPERPRFTALLERTVPFYDRRHLMRPGITGWATVRFGYGDSVTDKWRSHEYDLYYLKHRSLLLDLEILVRTMVVMLLRRGR